MNASNFFGLYFDSSCMLQGKLSINTETGEMTRCYSRKPRGYKGAMIESVADVLRLIAEQGTLGSQVMVFEVTEAEAELVMDQLGEVAQDFFLNEAKEGLDCQLTIIL